jgi:thymidine kinase
MAKLYFYYSSMNAGKSTALLQSSYNYRERGMNTVVMAPLLDDRYGVGKVTSRIGLESEATTFTTDDNLFEIVKAMVARDPLHCVLIDEAQFLTKEQVFQLGDVTDELNIPVLAYGLRTDFQGEPFEGSKYLLAWSDNLKELKAICHCGTKATMVLRMDESGRAVREGSQVEIGGNDRYVSMCRRHFKEKYFG